MSFQFRRALALTVAMAAAGFGCSHARRDEVAVIRQRVDAKKVQAWAKQILKEYPDRAELFAYFPGIHTDPTMVILSNPPAILRDMGILGRMGPSIHVSPAGMTSNRCVSLLYAESFGFGGDGHIIEAGDETYRQATNAQCVEWIPGVYYRYVHSP
ncbi:MAG TPA: hypothetical protein VN578_16270 [Candidatus Binatia bacterium]|jgi:hypothetical protein|nr:hypothetical protein [Candidatus Binatia bacterium]